MSEPDPFRGASPLRAFALVLRFFLELALLGGVGMIAVELTRRAPAWIGWPLAALAVLAVGVVWGALLSPKAPVRLPASARLLLELLLFGAVALGLVLLGFWLPAAIGFVLWAADRAALALTGPAAPRAQP